MIGRATEGDVRMAEGIILPDDTNVAAEVYGQLRRDRASGVDREHCRRRESDASISRAAEDDAKIKGVVLPDDIDVAAGVHGDLWTSRISRVIGDVHRR